MNALQSFYASKNVSQKASHTAKTADGRTLGFTLTVRVTDATDEAVIAALRKGGIVGTKETQTVEDDNGTKHTNTVTAKGGTLKEQVSVALFIMGYADKPKDKEPAKDTAKDKADATA